MSTHWKVVPISKPQLRDVRPEDLLNGGTFRKCDTYRGGGGYDQFPTICERRLGKRVHHQFVVQLYGCNLECSYCYVTQKGIWGRPLLFTSEELVKAFLDSEQEIFHLMGGAPAIYLRQWPELIEALPPGTVFHSDFLLTEHKYPTEILKAISHSNCLYAVDIKGVSPDDYRRNTNRKLNSKLFWKNLDLLVSTEVPFYLTFTNPDRESLPGFLDRLTDLYSNSILDDYFVIDLISYHALGVDNA